MINKNENYHLWVEAYRPQTIKDCILPADLREIFQGFVNEGDITNLFFYGSSGLGKSSVAKALANELKADLLVINGSDNRNIDIVRNTIRQFASTASIDNDKGLKIVLIDEADYLNRQSTQPALRAFMEEFSKTTRFIFTANYPSKMMPELVSRMVSVDFNIKADEKKDVMKQLLVRIFAILDNEQITYSKQVVAQVINKYFPDYRKILNELQRFTVGGQLSADIIKSLSDETFVSLVKLLKGKSLTGCQKWVSENPNINLDVIILQLWQDVDKLIMPESRAPFVLLANKYQLSAAQANNQVINTLAFFVELMLTISWQE